MYNKSDLRLPKPPPNAKKNFEVLYHQQYIFVAPSYSLRLILWLSLYRSNSPYDFTTTDFAAVAKGVIDDSANFPACFQKKKAVFS